MPIKYWIERERRRVRSVVTGDFTTEKIFQVLQEATTHEDFEVGFDVLSDHTQIGEPLTTPQAQQMTAYVENMKEVMGRSRWAVVTTKPSSYGMMRMLSAMLEPVPIIIRIFDTLEEADDWLSQPKGKKEPSMQS